MSRSLRAFLPVAGDADRLRPAFLDDPSRWLPDARQVGAGQWQLRLHGAGLDRLVLVRVGDPWRSGATSWRSLSWDPAGTPSSAVHHLLPTFDGELGLNLGAAGPTLILDGRYDPPGGGIGTALDALGLQHVARGTADRLLADIADHLRTASLLEATR